MTDKELRKLKREDFVEIIYQYQRREQKLLAENARLKAQLDDRYTRIEHAGSIAEAALSLNKVLESVQSAADQYLEEIKTLRDQAARGELTIPKPELPEVPELQEEPGSRKWNLDEIGSLLTESQQEAEEERLDAEVREEPPKEKKHLKQLFKKKQNQEPAPAPVEDDGAYTPKEQPVQKTAPKKQPTRESAPKELNPEAHIYDVDAGYEPVTRPEDMTMEDIDLLLESLKDL